MKFQGHTWPRARGAGEDGAPAGPPRSRRRVRRLVRILALGLACPWLPAARADGETNGQAPPASPEGPGLRAHSPAQPSEARPAPQLVFADGVRSIGVCFQNVTGQPIQTRLRLRLSQASSSTAMPVSDGWWKPLTVQPNQTVLDTAPVWFPAVKVPTRFWVQWVDERERVLGLSDVVAYPADLLREINNLTGGAPIGLFDPLNALKPAFQPAGVRVADWDQFSGRLAVVGPLARKDQWPEGLRRRVHTLARAGTAVVWLRPSDAEALPASEPAVVVYNKGGEVIVLAEARLVTDLAASPRAQLNLIKLIRLALNPEPVLNSPPPEYL